MLRKTVNKLSEASYCFYALEDHPIHRELHHSQDKYGDAIVQAKQKHWTDYLEEATANDIWTVNCYIKEPAGDGGNLCIPTLKVNNPNGAIRDINTNDEKAKAFADSFFPNPQCPTKLCLP
jgi:hypothetical protein